jgi:heme/copper-type cytochrome/quinol oxidase subunit 1
MLSRIRYTVALYAALALATISLIVWFHWTKEKGLPMVYLSKLSYLAIQSGMRIFGGTFTKGTERLSEGYIVIVTSLQGAVLGLVLDYFRYRRREVPRMREEEAR